MKSTTSTLPGVADPAEVVAAEVDEHHVLGALLVVGEQFLGESASSSGVAPRGGYRRSGAAGRGRR